MRVALFIAAVAIGAPIRVEDPPLAPDGRRGFGATTSLSDLLSQFRSPDDEELAFQTDLRDVARDVAVLVSVTEGFYRERGYFDLLDPLEEPTLDALHDKFETYSQDPGSIAPRRDFVARTFARLFLDTRFRARLEVLRGWQAEAAEVRGGLGVLRSAAHGFVTLDELQGQNIARRIDLAAAALRSLRNDLSSLREAMETAAMTGPDDQEVDEFLALFDIGERAAREARVAEAVAVADDRIHRMSELLFLPRLEAAASDDFARRAADASRARSLLEAARVAFPENDETETPREIARLSKSRRRKLARENAVLGLAYDPLNDELAWIAAETSRLVYGELEAVSHYDRFLALRGIVHSDDRTYNGRALTERETGALFYVQEFERITEGAGR